MGCRRSHIQFHLKHPRNSTLFHIWHANGSPALPFRLLWSKSWYKAMLHRPISMSSTITFHRRNRNVQMSWTGLLMQSGSFKSTIWWCLTMLVRGIAYPDLRTWYTVNSDTIETLFPYSQGVSLFLCRWTMMRYHKLSILGNNESCNATC